MRRAMMVLLAFVLLGGACGDDATTETTEAGAATTTAPDDTTTTTAAAATTTAAAVPAGPAFIMKGESGAYVRALQIYLDCAGYGPIEVDGVFGDGTAGFVGKAQADEGKMATGEPDEETFALLSRECDRTRDISFAAGASAVEVAGNAAPGDDEVLELRVLEGQQMTVTVDGAVDVAIQGSDGGVLHRPDGSLEIVVDVPSNQEYQLTVSAAAPTSYSLTVEVPAPPEETTTTTVAASGGFVLTADGFKVVEFGASFDDTFAAVQSMYGEQPEEDTGWMTEDRQGCAATARMVTWRVWPAVDPWMATTLDVWFFDEDDPRFVGWDIYLTGAWGDQPPLDAMPGWLSTVHGLSAGDSYNEAVSYGFTLGGYEELNQGSLDGLMVTVFEDNGYEQDGRVWEIAAGAWMQCDPF